LRETIALFVYKSQNSDLMITILRKDLFQVKQTPVFMTKKSALNAR